jgi:hypothetical protein
MEFVAETSAGPLELELRQVGGATVVALGGTGDTWNSAYTPVPLAAFLADFARLPDLEAQMISERVLGDWDASPESLLPKKRAAGRRVAATIGPSLVLAVVFVVALGGIVYFLARALMLAATE